MNLRCSLRRRAAALLGLWLCACTCGASRAGAQPPADALRAVLDGVLSESAHPYLPQLDLSQAKAALTQIYAARNFTPLWTAEHAISTQGLDVIRELRTAESKGLHSGDYDANRLAYLLIDLTLARSATDQDWGLFDIGLTAAVYEYARDLHFGRVDPHAAGLDLEIEHARLDLNNLILGLSHSGDVDGVLADIEPPFRHYELLKQQLARYRELALEPGLSSLPALPGKSVKPGGEYNGAPQLRRLLLELGDLTPEAAAVAPEAVSILEPNLVAALTRFQARHGLDADGALGQGTFAELRRPLRDRVAQIELTLERWRWLPPRLDTPPILVNIPRFRLYAFQSLEDREADMLTMDVIVGKAYPANRTPVFAADMKYIVLRPYWDVPYSITMKEMLPSIRSNPGYLAANQLELVNAAATPVPPTPENIEALGRGTLRLRQLPGPRNALGPAKFMFPNAFNVYLHGTPAQALFSRSSRAFSHGCVRVADPLALAEYVLRDDPSWTRERIQAAMQGTTPTQVNLTEPIRVFIVYGTAVATEGGPILFLKDVYGHDARLAELLRAHGVEHAQN